MLRLLRTAHDDIAVTSCPTGRRHDFQCPFMSLLMAFGTTPRSICGGVPYLRACPSEVGVWRRRLGPKRRPRIGIAWSGRQHTPINYPRDLSLDLLAPLLALDADFVCLQTEMAAADRDRVAIHRNLDTKSAAALTDFADTAALIENMDWVICADTAVAHLAGALGKTAWLMNRYASCWRWMQEGESTPWYPNMRIFRQQRLGDWKTVVKAIREETLRKFVEIRANRER